MEKKLRAVIYCRVSTNSDAQVESLDKQVSEAAEAVKQLGYELTDRFIDEGKSGTVKESRKEYLRMLSDISEDKFDVIVTKSLDRMNRNILDFYLFLDLIIKNDIKLYFYLDHAYYKTDDKIVIGIKAILAEEYSRELSKKLCSAHAKRQERGDVVMLSRMTYGYRKEIEPDGTKKVVIVEEEAEMIRLIFGYCREGYGTRAIGKILYERGYRNRNGNEITDSTIRRIIRNPLVMGTMIMNKVHFDFNTKTTIYTEPGAWIWKEDAVPAIISEEEWRAANAIMDSRLKVRQTDKTVRKQGVNKGKYNFSGKLVCGLCGKPYYQRRRKNKTHELIQWKCSTYLRFGRQDAEAFKTNSTKKIVDIGAGCDGPSIDENLLVKIMGDIAGGQYSDILNKKTIISETMDMLKKVLQKTTDQEEKSDLQNRFQLISQRQETLLEKYLDGRIADDSYTQMEEKLRKEKEKLAEQIENIEEERSLVYKAEQRLKKIEESLQNGGIEQAAAYTLVDSVKNIIIYKDRLELIFDSFQALGMEEYKLSKDKEYYHVEIPLSKYQMKNTNAAIRQSEELICKMIMENPKITIRQMAERLGIGARTAFDRVRTLKEEGYIGVSGHGTGSRWYLIDAVKEEGSRASDTVLTEEMSIEEMSTAEMNEKI